MPDPHSFFRPLLAADKSWAALDWRTAGRQSAEADDLVRCFVDAGAAPLASVMPLVVPIEPNWLTEGEFIEKFETDQAIFVLPAAALDDGRVIEECAGWRRKGRHLALQLAHGGRIKDVPRAAFDHLQVDATLARYELSADDLSALDRGGFRRIATGVGSLGLFEWLAARHFDFTDSGFVTIIDPTSAGEPDLPRLKVLKLLSLVLQDADSCQIEEVFRQEARLSYNLLRLVNSVAVGAKTRISSFHQAIALLGRRQLQRWLQLLIYADQLAHASKPNPLMQLAAERGRQMELLAGNLASPADAAETGDAAFMTGIFSLLDTLLKMPMSEILADLPLPPDVAAALALRQGTLGTLLAAVLAGEASDFTQAQALLASLEIGPAAHARAQIAAFYWASRINSER
ncbi:MAG: HDOD domain-containing protein [Candidatus Accumulibacter sp.]|uniref:EAL and HDOD domain-containing protein n=1 Tax=Accumulibacter sp. TaxID=2053492 RepID=UPI001A020543|nr:HDOD domain-containing protein [Accumulibacter sp.]MBE2260391.1 HDOD domain-containing protein [Paracoccaceae bacterium]MCB1942101.1 HDOD domain-containing protein [Accumulibacter sp.]MCP5248122.1 HDOD domain-containing protein [Accumulibacter sp.]